MFYVHYLSQWFGELLAAWFVLCAVVFVTLWFVSAPYGRHGRAGWGPQMPGPVGWLVMELPALALFPTLFALSGRRDQPLCIVFLAMWELHYVHRTVIYVWRRRKRLAKIPALVVFLGFVTNTWINYLNAYWLFFSSAGYETGWVFDPRFVIGALLFFGGLAVNAHSDEILLRLRARSKGGYSVPHGGAFRWVSCPNYAGELAEWAGWALATWSLPGLAFAAWSAANLVPRASYHHAWYRRTFDGYPAERRALIPYVF